MLKLSQVRYLVFATVALLFSGVASAQTQSGTTTSNKIPTEQAPSPVSITVYTPPGYDANRARPYPLVIQLHGGGGTDETMLRMAPLLDLATATGRIEPVVSVMPSVGRSFYMDYKDGSENWETFIVEDLISYMRENYNVAPGREGTLITGVSMGGMGAIRIAFKHPDIFQAVAGMEPGIEPATAFEDIQLRDRFWRSPALFAEVYGNPVDEAFWKNNNPANIAAASPDALIDLAIYLEAGDQDLFFLHHGTEFLHRVLFDAGISHEYRLVRGAEHVGPSIGPRFLDAMSFFDRVLNPPDWINADVEKTRARIDRIKEKAGYPINPHDPRKLRTE